MLEKCLENYTKPFKLRGFAFKILVFTSTNCFRNTESNMKIYSKNNACSCASKMYFVARIFLILYTILNQVQSSRKIDINW